MNAGKPEETLRPVGLPLRAADSLELLEKELKALSENTEIPERTRALRKALAEACRVASKDSARLFTLTAPTGSGKTLAMLLFALLRATQEGSKVQRIVVVLPFLTILDQTVEIYRDLFKSLGEHYILEHHSLTGTRTPANVDEPDESSDAEKEARLLTQNWDAPIVITTTVQLLESLFANRPGACRKLHHLQNSVILFDEVQTLPLELATATLKALSTLVGDEFNATVLFSTATQPAFERLDAKVREGEPGASWNPKEIVPSSLGLFAQAKRVEADWRHAATRTEWETVSDWLAAETQALCVVNVKDHARTLVERLKEKRVEGVMHLSTALCPAHRRMVLDQVRAALDPETKQSCRLIATQCIEAGVDLDFPRAFRALGPLEAIAQVAGRCNRAGKAPTPGILTVFLPEEEKYPRSEVYKRAAQMTLDLLGAKGSLDINDPALFTEYFERLYNLSKMENEDLAAAIKSQDYVKVAQLYRLIKEDTFNVVVPYNEEAEALMQEAREKGIHGAWIRRARAYTVTVFRTSKTDPLTFLEGIVMRRTRKPAPDWYLCGVKDYYDAECYGFLPNSAGPSGFFA